MYLKLFVIGVSSAVSFTNASVIRASAMPQARPVPVDVDSDLLPQAPLVAAAQAMVLPSANAPSLSHIALPAPAADTDDSPAVRAAPQPEGCTLAGQVKLCVNHSLMQRATCASDDLDCQCVWASKITTCYAPCLADKESVDGMHVAKGEQEAVCSQAAKFGKIAKDKERQRLEEKNTKGKKRPEQSRTSAPKNIIDVNSAHEMPSLMTSPASGSQDDKWAHSRGDGSSSDAKEPEHGGEKSGSGAKGRAAGSSGDGNRPKNLRPGKGVVGGDSDMRAAESGAQAVSRISAVALALAFASLCIL
ncbi:hypothetical protein GQ54DRAFT_306085 [Martensiomyces pterosporus]|nr:hypothetical protein GQ54DRAFT_306085 [Martensiomyces pterosporus]